MNKRSDNLQRRGDKNCHTFLKGIPQPRTLGMWTKENYSITGGTNKEKKNLQLILIAEQAMLTSAILDLLKEKLPLSKP